MIIIRVFVEYTIAISLYTVVISSNSVPLLNCNTWRTNRYFDKIHKLLNNFSRKFILPNLNESLRTKFSLNIAANDTNVSFKDYCRCYRILPRSSHSQMFFKIGILTNSANFTGKHFCSSLLLIKLQASNVIKKSLQQRCFTVNFAKLLRVHFFYRTPAATGLIYPPFNISHSFDT